MSAAEKPTTNLHTMADYSALTMLANGRNRLNGTLEAVKRVPCPGGDQLESLVVFITANFAFRHLAPLLLTVRQRPCAWPPSATLPQLCLLATSCPDHAPPLL